MHEIHSDEQVADIIQSGSGYMASISSNVIFKVIADAVEAVGVDNFNSQALYDATQSFSMTMDGVDFYSFGEKKRTILNYMSMYEMRGSEEDLFRVDPEWIAIEHEP